MLGYFDCPSGISGDMILSCLVDAGWPVEELRGAVSGLSLPAEEYSIDAAEVTKGPLRAMRVSVQVRRTMHRRTLSDIEAILARSRLNDAVRDRARAVFRRLAEAEAAVHGMSIERVHFHEVGAVDAIVDIVGAAAGIEALGIERLGCSPLPLGHGWVKSDHGPLPLPAPATLHLLAAASAPTRPAPGEGELVTPTGAAIVTTLCTFEQPAMTLSRIGTGAGGRDLPWPNVARLWLGEASPAAASAAATHVQLETNVDDMNPQFYAPLLQALFDAGAVDAWLAPVQMKKNRPGVVVSALAPIEHEAALAQVLLNHSTTLGVRITPVRRHEADRRIETVQTPFGPVRVKVKLLDNQRLDARPEFDDCLRLAQQHGLPVQRIYDEALRASPKATV